MWCALCARVCIWVYIYCIPKRLQIILHERYIYIHYRCCAICYLGIRFVTKLHIMAQKWSHSSWIRFLWKIHHYAQPSKRRWFVHFDIIICEGYFFFLFSLSSVREDLVKIQFGFIPFVLACHNCLFVVPSATAPDKPWLRCWFGHYIRLRPFRISIEQSNRFKCTCSGNVHLCERRLSMAELTSEIGCIRNAWNYPCLWYNVNCHGRWWFKKCHPIRYV